ncbi:hypothetical protein [Fodinicola feengrottensis]|uniref:hypothetical protein n=1 Tax=Fodinicola feengrottensis TaxID=435914 RepID=UPI0013D3129A|nr:hypothetical protein [Fodinicola feengrottensis]
MTLQLDPHRLAVEAADLWQDAPAPRMGLISSDNQLLDGLYVPASVPPGATGMLLLLAGDPPATHARVRGQLWVTGPFPDAYPLPFETTA